MELMAGILTWMGLGWLGDQWLGTMPWLMVAGALIGNAAGLYLIWVRSRDSMQEGEAGRPTRGDPDDEPVATVAGEEGETRGTS